MKKQLVMGAAAAALVAAISAGSAFALTAADMIGEAGNAVEPVRVIQLSDQARYVNVDAGEIVRIEGNGKAFTWQFNGLANQVKLSEIAPQDFGTADITVYVDQSTNALFQSDGDGDND